MFDADAGAAVALGLAARPPGLASVVRMAIALAAAAAAMPAPVFFFLRGGDAAPPLPPSLLL